MADAVPSGQGIDVGDAVFRFLGDTQSLDIAVDKVDAIPGKMGAASASINDTQAAVEGLGREMTVGQQGAVELGEVMQLSGEKGRESMYQARGEAALLGEEFGIHLPRHVRSFIAELPGVGEALSAAFTATAVLFLIEALVKVTEKLSDWVGATFIFTSAMKASDAAIGAANKTILEQNDAYKKAQEAMEAFGLTGSVATQHKIEELTDSIQENEKSMRGAKDQIYGLQHGFDGLTGSVGDSENQIRVLNATLKAQREVLAVLQAKHDEEQTAEVVKAEEARIQAVKTASTARINLTTAEGLFRLAVIGSNYSQQLALTQKNENDILHLELKSIAERISALTFLGDKTLDQRKQLSAEMEKLVDDHNAKVFKSYATVYNDIRKSAAALQPDLAKTDETISNDLTKALDEASDAAQRLGFAFTGDVYKSLEQTKKAYEDLKSSGQATYADLLRGQAAVLRAQIEYDKEFGVNTGNEEAQLGRVLKAWDKLTGGVHKTHVQTHDFWRQFQIDLKDGVSGLADLKDMSEQAFNQLGHAIEGAVASALLGQESIGEALKKATAAALASLASQAIVKALFYTAEGFAAMAGFEEQSAGQFFTAAGIMAGVGVAAGAAALGLSGGGGGNNRGSNSAPADNSAAVQSSGGTSSSVNIQRLATGGLVTRPTMVMLGDAISGGGADEAAIPLDNPTAMAKIVAGLQKAGMTPQSGPAGHTFIIQGLISADNLHKVVEKINKGVDKNQLHLKSSDTQRVTRRSN